jgi:hypothetical protein
MVDRSGAGIRRIERSKRGLPILTGLKKGLAPANPPIARSDEIGGPFL